MKLYNKLVLIEAWNQCDESDKSTEYMLQYMSDVSGLDYDCVVNFVIRTDDKERKRLSRLLVFPGIKEASK